jgi:Tfp pilus assembly protein PilX
MNETNLRKQAGIVLPVVLVLLMVMSSIVMFTIRRATVDEQLARNVRDIVTMDTAAQYALRHCERWLWISPPGLTPEPGMPNPPAVVPTVAAGNPAAWNQPALVTASSNILPAASLGEQAGARISDGRCLIEDASNELQRMRTLDSGNLPSQPEWRKFRVTAIVTSPGAAGDRLARAQSEIRMLIGGGP